MTFVARFWRHPRQVWIRKVNFQIHLWLGIALALYLVVIGVTGSLLVVRIELGAMTGANAWETSEPVTPRVSVSEVIRNLHARYPGFRVLSVRAPGKTEPHYIARLLGAGQIRVAVDAGTGEVLPQIKRGAAWLDVVERLHTNWFLSRKGRVLNGVGGALLLLMCVTGLVNWWPGIRSWKRALKVDFRRSWRRVNFDLHSATGFWTLALISFWGISGIYFAWPRQVFNFVNRISPIVNSKPPAVEVTARGEMPNPDLDALEKRAWALDPGTTLAGVEFPFNRRAPMQILMRRGNGLSREYEDTLYFDPYTGEHLKTWRYGVNQSLGDWFIWAQVPLHFGVYWGVGFKIVWALLGLAVPTLAVTGLVMYWNRSLSKTWSRIKVGSV
ncbi:MAG TPA: PepSY-associated TM helix domain-containing protein [Bryobacteraceae bacterium]|nr:PepSY-associated TM helix domain-containing protein [Bryobacteraceae bacterium]